MKWVNIDDYCKEFIQNVLEPGECFGEFLLFDDLPFDASAIAETITDCILCVNITLLNMNQQYADKQINLNDNSLL